MGDNSNRVRQRILDLIEDGGLGPDGRLETERALCAQLSVGRRTLRQVLDSLEAEGLIWRRQGKGTFAGQPPDPTGALAAAIAGGSRPEEVMEARLWIEPALAALCARNAGGEAIVRMRDLARRVFEAADDDAAELWDSALHRLIARTAGNRPLLTAFALLDEIRGSEDWQRLRARSRNRESLHVIDQQHHAIVDAIAAGDERAAETAMRAHMLTLAANLARGMEAAAPASAMRDGAEAERFGARVEGRGATNGGTR